MRGLVLFLTSMAAYCACAWNSIAEMETDICVALTNDSYLLSAPFTNQLNEALGAASVEMRCEAHMLLAINAYHNFLKTIDESWLQRERINASNAVVDIGLHADKWQYWSARFIYAGAFASIDDYMASYSIITNVLKELSIHPYTNNTASVESRIIEKFEMSDIDITTAFKVLAGMSAAELGLEGTATNYANQVPVPYRNMIFDFIK